MTFNFEIISPQKVVYKEEVDEVIIPTTAGQITILPNHAALMSKVSSGEIIVKKNGKQYYMAISGGFLDVNNNNVSVLADYAVRSEEIEVAHAIEAQKRAEKMMRESSEKASKKDFAQAEGELRRSLLELKVASRRRKITLPPGTNL